MKSAIREIYISIIYWTLAILFSTTIRFVGIDFFLNEPVEMSLLSIYLNTLPGGIIGGFVWGLLEVVDQRIKRSVRHSFSRVIISKTLLYIVIFTGISFIASWIGFGSTEQAIDYLNSNISIGNFVFFIVAAFLYHLIKQMSKKMGSGILTKYLTGKYFHPIEENRIFMFLDLKSSTTIAEKLSHVLYSKLIQECFAELTAPLIKFKGQVYQYVGDEVVISWLNDEGITNSNCVRFFYEYMNRLKNKKEYFLKTFNIFPEFKAGMSMGLVTAAEVGELKTEIAYHGDVLNTAARIQELCNKYEKQLLASESLVKELSVSDEYKFNPIGNLQLKGKSELVKVFSCEKK